MLFGTKKFMLMNSVGDGGSGGGTPDVKPDSGNQGGEDSGNPPKDGNKGEGDDSTGGDQNLTPEQTAKLIKDLRAENAKHRTEKNNLSSKFENIQKKLKQVFGEEDDDAEAPDVKIGKLEQERNSIAIQNTVLVLALKHGISAENLEFFEFKFMKQLNALEEGEEFSEENLEEILKTIPKTNGTKPPANSSTGSGGKPPQNDSGDSVTLEQFAKMGPLDKDKLYREKPDTYNKLFTEAKNKRLL